ncbi:MAG: glycosyl hydrolase family 18 protein, partial [Methanobacterium paludis]|nr:glycosyl hydrolase family 18 protein [Methanobacterium paludis]
MKRHLLLLMLLLLSVASIGLNNTYATTANQQNSENLTNDNFSSLNTTYIQNTTNIQNTTAGSANASTVVSNTSKSPVNTTNSTESATNSTSNSDNSNGSATIQNTTEAAGDGSYNKIHGIWLSTDDVNNVSVDELKASGITDIFVKANRISVPTYQSVLKTVLEKFKDSGIRVNAWITCFVDSNGKWIDPQSTKGTKTINDILNQVTDITTNYDIDGIHLDYVRYPGTAYKHAGGTETITKFVKQVYETVKSINKNVAVSAALMPECGDNAYNYGQNYTALSSYLDFLVPMTYKGNYRENTTWIGKTTAYIVSHANGKPVVAGIQTYSSDDNLTVLP